MAKTLNQFLEGKTAATGYLKVKSPDEQKFVDKHVRVTTAEPAGNGDEVFKASKIKTIERKQGRKGYNPGEDEAVYEGLTGKQHKIDANKNGKVDAHDFHLLRKKKKVAEEAEQIDEISSGLAQSYLQKKRERDYNTSADGKTHTLKKPTTLNRLNRDVKGTVRALKTIEKTKNEEVEALEELSTEKLLAYRKKAREADTNKHHVYADEADKKIKKKTGVYNPNLLQRAKAKLRMGEEFIDLLATGEIVFANEEIRSISEREVTLIATVLNRLSEENQDQFCEVALKSLDGFDKMLSFAIQNKGE